MTSVTSTCCNTSNLTIPSVLSADRPDSIHPSRGKNKLSRSDFRVPYNRDVKIVKIPIFRSNYLQFSGTKQKQILLSCPIDSSVKKPFFMSNCPFLNLPGSSSPASIQVQLGIFIQLMPDDLFKKVPKFGKNFRELNKCENFNKS